jgi:hypothetical protein
MMALDDYAKSLEPKARELLRSPGLLFKLQETITREEAEKGFVVGEEKNAALLLFCIIQKQSVEVRGSSSGGKNNVVEAVLRIVPAHWVKTLGASTDKALRWLDEDTRILYMKERKGLSGFGGKESGAEYDAKLVISEGKIGLAFVARDPETGRMRTEVNPHVIDMLISTTTDIVASPELENRLEVITVHDDRATTAKVRDAKLEKASMWPSEMRDYSDEENIAGKAVALIDSEAPKHVIVPFGPVLARILREETTTTRRHTDKLLRMIRACTRLHYLQRPIVQDRDRKVLIALPADLAIVLEVGAEMIQDTMGAISGKMSQLVELARTLSKEGSQITRPALQNLARKQKLDELTGRTTISELVRELTERGIFRLMQDEEGNAVKLNRAFCYVLNEADGELMQIDAAGMVFEACAALEAWLEDNADRPGLIHTPAAYCGFTWSEADSRPIGADGKREAPTDANGGNSRPDVVVPEVDSEVPTA